MYSHLKMLWDLVKDEGGNKDELLNEKSLRNIINVMFTESRRLYMHYTAKEPNVANFFSSDQDLLIKFIISLDSKEKVHSKIKYEILHKTDEYQPSVYKPKNQNKKQEFVEKTSLIVSIIGIIVAILDMFF